uniref:Uncharacterized protein n=1 Tax=Acrobeloides nanus TaxID=290746 RepID=A0A914DI83_9BILA
MGPAYGILCVVLYLKPKNLPTITKLQKVMLMQSLAICFEMFIVAIVYVGNQWISVPEIMTKIEHIALICVHGDTPIVYLLFNKTLRKQSFGCIKGYVFKSAKDAKHLAAYVYPRRHHRVQNLENQYTAQNGANA